MKPKQIFGSPWVRLPLAVALCCVSLMALVWHSGWEPRRQVRSGQVFAGEARGGKGAPPAEAVKRWLVGNLSGLGVAAALALILGWSGGLLLVFLPVRSALIQTWDTERQSADAALRSSELRYRQLFEGSQDGILIADAETGVIEDVNPALLNLLGCARKRLVGSRLWEIGRFKDSHAGRSAFEELRQAGYVRCEDLPLETRDGRLILVEFVSSVYAGQSGKVIQWNLRDVTRRRHLEMARSKLAAIVESSDDAIIGKDLTGRIVSWNLAAERLFGYRAGEMVGQSVNRIIPPDLESEELILLDRVRHGEGLDHFETARVARDGRRIPISLTISPICDGGGTIVGASTIAPESETRRSAINCDRDVSPLASKP